MRATATEGATPTRAYERLTYQPALDGLRAVAVGGVLMYHQNPGRMPGGWLGVSMFFTLSGFLIGGLVLAEGETTGGVDLLRFWRRRLRRLLPASCLALVMAFAVVFVNDIGGVRAAVTDIASAALQVANWRFIGADAAYAGLHSEPSPVQHYWSLAIEEQFYWVFPLFMAFAFRRRRLLVPALVAVIAVGTYVQVTSDSFNEIYFGTHTRAPEIAAGVLLAVAAPRIAPWSKRHPWTTDIVGAVAVLVTAVLFLGARLDLTLLNSGLLSIASAVWTALIVSLRWGRVMPRLLSWRPLPSIGLISYGIYLFHWPVFLVVNEQRLGTDGPVLLLVRVAITLVISVASARFVENPIRRADDERLRTFTLAGAAVAVLVAVAVVVPQVRHDSASADSAFHTPPSPVTPSDAGATRVPRILVAGDSTASAVGIPFQEVAAAEGEAEVYVRAMAGCTLLPYERARIRDGYVYDPGCPDVTDTIVQIVDEHDIDAVILLIGTPQLMDLELAGLSGWHSIDEPAVADMYRTEAQAALERLNDLRIPILWADVAAPEWDLDAFGALFGQPSPGSGEAVTNDPVRYQTLNEIDDALAAELPNVTRVAYADALVGSDGTVADDERMDGLHLAPEFAAQLSRTALLDLFEAAYRDVRADPSADLVPAGDSAWDLPA